jgi:GNAT superfamily N-acetyltransferase
VQRSIVGIRAAGATVAIRRLGRDDQDACAALCRDRGWLPQAKQWALLLDESEVFGIDAPDGDGLAGTVALTRYGGQSAAVGMMLVATRYGRGGLGRALLEHALDAAGQCQVFLTATAMGRPLYASLGFKYVRRSAKFIGAFAPDPATTPRTRVAGDADMPAILHIDKAAFGADRGFLLRALAGGAAQAIRMLPDSTGYAALWDAGDTVTVGPVVAPSPEAARWLIGDLAATARGPIRIDIDPDGAELPGWLAAHGVPQSGETSFMIRPSADGRTGGPDGTVYALLSPAVG